MIFDGIYGDTLQLGSTGNNVKTLQYDLNSLGYSLTMDGQFGSATKAAVSKFQTDYSLPVTGIADDALWGQLANVDRGELFFPDSTDPVSKVFLQMGQDIGITPVTGTNPTAGAPPPVPAPFPWKLALGIGVAGLGGVVVLTSLFHHKRRK